MQKLARSTIALAVLAAAGAAHAAPTQDQLLAELRRLAERVEKLERRNAELESRQGAVKRSADTASAKGSGDAASTKGGGDAALAARVEALETANRQLAASLESERISADEPEFITRLKAVETQSLSYQKQARMIDSLEGISAEASVVAVAQRINGQGRTDGKDETQLNWRGDVSVALPGGEMGGATGQFFAHVRLGQGESFTDTHPMFTGALNSTAFQLADLDGDRNAANSTALLAQAWYQLTVPLPLGGFADRSKEHIEVNVGKIDPFVFFDQNTVADNEAEKFLNNVFVHNPMLDSGGAMGVDDYGFTPGLRVAYHNEQAGPEWWQASLGVFGAGEGAKFGKSFTRPMVIGQLELGRKLFGGLDGNYRLYAWRNGQYEGYDGDTGTSLGWGLSADQRVGDDLTLFARYGHTTRGKVPFDRALTLGGELTGNAWGRGADGLGFAWAWLRASEDFRDDAPGLLDEDGNALFPDGASGAEQIAEIYYRWYVSSSLSLTPDLQYIRRAAASRDEKNVTAVGLRALYAF